MEVIGVSKSKRERLEEKMEQLKAQLNEEKNKERARERKARTRRLIDVGSVFESYFGEWSKEDAVKVAKYFTKVIKEKESEWRKVPLNDEEKEKHNLKE